MGSATQPPDVNNAEVVAEICARLACGETTRKITRELNVERAFWKRMGEDKDFAATIAQARVAGQDALTAETIDIADEGSEEDVNHRKLRIWARQWYASKLAPKKYGERTQTEITGADGTPLVVTWKKSDATG